MITNWGQFKKKDKIKLNVISFRPLSNYYILSKDMIQNLKGKRIATISFTLFIIAGYSINPGSPRIACAFWANSRFLCFDPDSEVFFL